MKVHAEKCVERYYEFERKEVSSFQQVATPRIEDYLIPPQDFETIGELSTVCAQCLCLARSGPDLLWSVNTLERSTTEWSKACDKL